MSEPIEAMYQSTCRKCGWTHGQGASATRRPSYVVTSHGSETLHWPCNTCGHVVVTPTHDSEHGA